MDNKIAVSSSSFFRCFRLKKTVRETTRKVSKTNPETEIPIFLVFLSVSILLISRGSRLELYSHDRSLNNPDVAENPPVTSVAVPLKDQ